MRVIKEHDERKNEILDIAEKLFIAKGYDKTTISDILKEANIAKGTLYHYFKSKEEIMDAVIMRIIDHDICVAKEILEVNNISAFDKILRILLTQSSKESKQKREIIEQFSNTDNTVMKQRALESSIQYVCPILAKVIEEGNRTKEFNTSFPLESIQFLVAGMQTLLDERMMKIETTELERRLDSFVDIIIRVLGINEDKIDSKEVHRKIKQIF